MDIDISFVIQYNYCAVVLLKVNCILLSFFFKKEDYKRAFIYDLIDLLEVSLLLKPLLIDLPKKDFSNKR